MATKLGVNATNMAASPSKLAEQGDQGGNVKCIFDSYTLTADLAANDIIKIGGLLPAGARVVGGWVNYDDLDASGGTMDLGYAASADAVEAADDDAFCSNIDVTSAGITNIVTANLVGLGKRFSAPVQVQAKIEGDTDATTGTIKVCILYTLD